MLIHEDIESIVHTSGRTLRFLYTVERGKYVFFILSSIPMLYMHHHDSYGLEISSYALELSKNEMEKVNNMKSIIPFSCKFLT